jgi:tricorn protease
MRSPSRRFNQFFKQPVAGGMPEPLPLMYAELASFSPDGTRMAFQYISTEFRTWKRYRGGMASDLWIYDLVNNTSEKFTDFAGTDAVPMWRQDTIYFMSDRDAHQKLNIWAYELRTRRTRQVTHFTEYDVKWPSIGPDAIVFENGGLLHLLDLDTETSKPLSIQVPTDLPQIRPELKNVSNRIESWSLSPTGKRALFEARGELFTVPEKHGSIRNLTNTSGVAERDPAWSPDGKSIAYFSDKTGEYELYLRPGDEKGREKQITHDGLAFRYRPVWSPDSRKIAFSDKTGSLYVVDVNDGNPAFVDKDEWFDMASYSCRRQPVADLRQARGQPPRQRHDLRLQRRHDPPGHQRLLRRGQPRLRRRGQVPVLHVRSRVQSAVRRHGLDLDLSEFDQTLRRDAQQGGRVPAGAAERRGRGQEGQGSREEEGRAREEG